MLGTDYIFTLSYIVSNNPKADSFSHMYPDSLWTLRRVHPRIMLSIEMVNVPEILKQFPVGKKVFSLKDLTLIYPHNHFFYPLHYFLMEKDQTSLPHTI